MRGILRRSYLLQRCDAPWLSTSQNQNSINYPTANWNVDPIQVPMQSPTTANAVKYFKLSNLNTIKKITDKMAPKF